MTTKIPSSLSLATYIDKNYKEATLECIRKIKHSIEVGEENHICIAASLVLSRHGDLTSNVSTHDLRKIVMGIKQYISDSLYGYLCTYDKWLESELERPVTPEEPKLGRLAWLDRMIQEVKTA